MRKWRVFKMRGMWVVRRPGGGHFGSYFTWDEAIRQASVRSRRQLGSTTGGSFERRGAWSYGDHVPFGFAQPIE